MVKARAICDFVGMKPEGSFINEGTIMILSDERFKVLEGFGYVKKIATYPEKVEDTKRETKELKYDSKRTKRSKDTDSAIGGADN